MVKLSGNKTAIRYLMERFFIVNENHDLTMVEVL